MEQNEMTPRREMARVGWALFFMILASLVSQYLLDIFIRGNLRALYDSNMYGVILSMVSVVGIGYSVFYAIIRKVPDSERGEVVRLTLTQFVAIFIICTAFMYLSVFFGNFLNWIISSIKEADVIDPLGEFISNGNWMLIIFYTTIIAPIMEEIVFRKILLNKIRKYGDLPAILFSSFAFGLVHKNLSQFIYATCLGFFFAYVTIKTNTITYSILLHLMINIIGTAIAPMLVASGNQTSMALFGLWVIISIVLGLILFAKYRKGIELEKGEVTLERKSILYIQVGSILYLTVCVAVMVLYFFV